MTLDSCRAAMEEAVTRYLQQLPDNTLNEPVRYVMAIGGKRMRPALTLLAAGMYRSEVSAAVKPALALEVFHNFTLLHDDIMDKAPLRRGQPTVHEKWNQNAAILSGDAMLIHAYALMCEAPAHCLSTLLALFNRTALQVCEGQQLDMDYELSDQVDHDQYIGMITLKTSVLLGCALQTGAVIGQASPEDAEHFYQTGVDLGIAFQLMDDYLDAFGDPAKVGKRVGGDIAAGKKTYLLIRTKELCNAVQRQKLDALLRDTDHDRRIAGVLSLYGELGIQNETEQLVKHYHDLAMDHLHAISLPAEKKQPLIALADQLLVRQY